MTQLSDAERVAQLAERIRQSGTIPSIDISGPAGVGKDTITQRLAEVFEGHSFSTGNIYRTFAFLVLQETGLTAEQIQQLPQSELFDVLSRLVATHISFDYQQNQVEIILREQTQEVSFSYLRHDADISAIVSFVAACPAIRERAAELYRETVVRTSGMMGNGRDGDRVLSPEALQETVAALGETGVPYVLLLYLFADEDMLIRRALWRELEALPQVGRIDDTISDHDFDQLVTTHISPDRQQQIADNIRQRNQLDYQKSEDARLLQPSEAIESGAYDAVIDSGQMSIDQVLVAILQIIVDQQIDE